MGREVGDGDIRVRRCGVGTIVIRKWGVDYSDVPPDSTLAAFDQKEKRQQRGGDENESRDCRFSLHQLGKGMTFSTEGLWATLIQIVLPPLYTKRICLQYRRPASLKRR